MHTKRGFNERESVFLLSICQGDKMISPGFLTESSPPREANVKTINCARVSQLFLKPIAKRSILGDAHPLIDCAGTKWRRVASQFTNATTAVAEIHASSSRVIRVKSTTISAMPMNAKIDPDGSR